MKKISFLLCFVIANSICFSQNAIVKTKTAYPGGIWEPGPAKHGSTVVDEVPIKMDDGIVLRASVAYPTDLATGQKAAGKFPVVVEHTPYVTLAKPINPITFFAEHGYITVVVRVRGAGTSEGEVQVFGPRDRQDGKAIVDWAANKLEGSDGRVAFIGCSYPGGLALNSAATAGKNSPLKAVVCACNGFESVNRQSWMVSGIPTTGFTNYTNFGPYLFGNSEASKRFFDRVVNEMMAGEDIAYDRNFWKERLPMEMAQDVVKNDVPVLLWSGWKDILDVQALKTLIAFQNAHAGRPVHAPMLAKQKTTPRYQLIMGGWEHAHGLDLGIYLQWLETWLKGVNTGIQSTKTPFHLFEGGTDRWINADRYPLVADNTSWFLDGSGTLKSKKPTGSGGEKLVWGDPSKPDGKLSFTTQPFLKGTTLAGPISATIYAKSTNTNLQLIAKLYDVAADGSETQITYGVMVGSQRKLDEAKSWKEQDGTIIWPWTALQGDEYLTPGQVYRFDVMLSPRQWGIQPNHRLRLELTTQSAPDVCPPSAPPPKNGSDPCRLTKPQQETIPGGIYTILHEPNYPSALHLPQMSYNYYPTATSGTTPTAWDEGPRTFTDKPYSLPMDWGKSKK